MSDKRVIKINPDIFKIPESTKKRRPVKDKPIKVKPAKNNNNKSIRRKVLNMIREKQQERRKPKGDSKHLVETDVEDKGEFDQSLEYLGNLSKSNHNSTVKRYNEIGNNEIGNDSFFTNDTTVNDMTNNISLPNDVGDSFRINVAESPKYGCLKNGNLPTYRNWMNTTRRQLPNQPTNPSIVNPSIVNPSINNPSINNPSIVNPSIVNPSINNPSINNPLPTNNAIKLNEFKQFQSVIPKKQPKKMRLRKKIIRRNYTVGRSKTNPKIAVLVSNKTIRKNIMNTDNLLKQTPIQEVRKFLIKRGLIKVGSIAPNDVLRKMYESASMMCGEIYNHNPDNLLYNYFNYNSEI